MNDFLTRTEIDLILNNVKDTDREMQLLMLL